MGIKTGQAEDAMVADLKRQVGALKLELEEAKSLAAAKERVLKASITELEDLYGALKAKLVHIRTQGYEIQVLNALNSIIATASMHINIGDILKPTLDVIISSVEELQKAAGKKVTISGGIFLLDDESGELRLAATKGITPEMLGCGGRIPAGECLCGEAVSDGGVIVSSDCLKDKRHSRLHPGSRAVEHAHVSIPLKSGNKVTGVAFLYIEPPGYDPPPADLSVFAAIGSYLGMHIEKALLYRKVKDLATRDGLTGLYNRREFERLIELEVQRSERYGNDFSLLMLDIDFFKKINDEYGHPFGDTVLRELGSAMSSELRSFDVAARYGGEEFAVILPDTGIDQAVKTAERLREKIGGLRVGSSGVSFTVSVGAASFLAAPPTALGVIKAADLALYSAKEMGRNMVCRFAGTGAD